MFKGHNYGGETPVIQSKRLSDSLLLTHDNSMFKGHNYGGETPVIQSKPQSDSLLLTHDNSMFKGTKENEVE